MSGSKDYDISASISSETTIRFRVYAYFGGWDEFFVLENVQISSDGGVYEGDSISLTFRDEFNEASFTNNNGTVKWSDHWNEMDPLGIGPEFGKLRTVQGALTLHNQPYYTDKPSCSREVDLSNGIAWAFLSFDSWTSDSVDYDDEAVVEVSNNGGES